MFFFKKVLKFDYMNFKKFFIIMNEVFDHLHSDFNHVNIISNCMQEFYIMYRLNVTSKYFILIYKCLILFIL